MSIVNSNDEETLHLEDGGKRNREHYEYSTFIFLIYFILMLSYFTSNNNMLNRYIRYYRNTAFPQEYVIWTTDDSTAS